MNATIEIDGLRKRFGPAQAPRAWCRLVVKHGSQQVAPAADGVEELAG